MADEQSWSCSPAVFHWNTDMQVRHQNITSAFTLHQPTLRQRQNCEPCTITDYRHHNVCTVKCIITSSPRTLWVKKNKTYLNEKKCGRRPGTDVMEAVWIMIADTHMIRKCITRGMLYQHRNSKKKLKTSCSRAVGNKTLSQEKRHSLQIHCKLRIIVHKHPSLQNNNWIINTSYTINCHWLESTNETTNAL